MFLYHIMQQSKHSLVYRFFLAQARFPTHRDWTSEVLEDLEVINLKMEFNDISKVSKDCFRNCVIKHKRENAFRELIERKMRRVSEYASRGPETWRR